MTLKSSKAMMQPPIPKVLDSWRSRLLRASWTKSTCTYIIIFSFKFLFFTVVTEKVMFA